MFAKDRTKHPSAKEYPENWAREWYAFQAASNPPFTDKDGHPILHWRQKMITAWRIHERDQAEANRNPRPQNYVGGVFAQQAENVNLTTNRGVVLP